MIIATVEILLYSQSGGVGLNEFGGIAERVAGHLSEASLGGGIRPGDIVDIVGEYGRGGAINCYPGIPGNSCHELAVFVSLTSEAHKGKHRGHLTCRQAIEKLVQHMQGTCAGVTLYAVLIVDSWDGNAASEWTSNLERIKTEAHLEVYLMVGGSASLLSV
jgi:hypothetical protein